MILERYNLSDTSMFYPERVQHAFRCLEQDGFGQNGNKLDFSDLMRNKPLYVADILLNRVKNSINGLTILNRDGGKYEIFNRHDEPHITNVSKNGLLLLAECGNVTVEELQVFNVMSILHDMGNLISREQHSAISVQLFDEIFSNYDPEDPRVVSILLGTLLHDHVGIYAKDLSTLPREGLLPRPIWALIAADKMDIGEHRLSTTLLKDPLPASMEELVEQYPHMILSLYAKSTTWKLSEDKKTLRVQINFSSDARRSVEQYASAILQKFQWKRATSQRVSNDLWAPNEWFDAARKNNIAYALMYSAKLEQLYAERIAQMNHCLFALYPSLEDIYVDVVDKNPRTPKNAGTTYIRHTWEHALYHVWKQREKAKGKITDEVRKEDVPPNLLKGWEMDQQRIAEEWRQTPG